MIELAKDLARGAVIGVANVIPGVSGGTMALVMGIYERFIGAINNLSGNSIVTLVALLKPGKVENRFEKIRKELENIDAWFLAKIMIGAMIAILALASLMGYLLTEHHDPTYGFFWGLVLLSVIAPYNLIKKKTPALLVAGFAGIVAVLAVTGSVSDDTLIKRAEAKYERELKKQEAAKAAEASGAATDASTKTPALQLNVGVGSLVLFLAMGAAAISAMILPGISGSLLMLIMGGYFDILKAVDDMRAIIYFVLGRGELPPTALDSVVLLGFFALGCVLGLVIFSRLLKYLLKNYHDMTMSFLTGLVIGSLWSIWPFKNTTIVGDSTIYLGNTWPAQFGANELLTFVMIAIGCALVGLMLYLEAKFSDEKNG